MTRVRSTVAVFTMTLAWGGSLWAQSSSVGSPSISRRVMASPVRARTNDRWVRIVAWGLAGAGVVATGVGVWLMVGDTDSIVTHLDGTPWTAHEGLTWAIFRGDLHGGPGPDPSWVCERAATCRGYLAAEVHATCQNSSFLRRPEPELGAAVKLGGLALSCVGVLWALSGLARRSAQRVQRSPWIAEGMRGGVVQWSF